MLRLSANATALATDFELDPRRSLLFSAIRLDSHPLVVPLIATRDGGDATLLVRQQEQGNVLSAGVAADRIRFYAPWVTIDPRPVAGVDTAESLTALVSELAGDEKVVLGPEIVYAHQLALADTLDITVEPAEPVAVTVHAIPTADVEKRFAHWRERGARTASELVAAIAHLKGIDAYFSTADTRFAKLESVAAEKGLSAIVITAPPNYSEVTARPARDGDVAIWIPGSDQVFVVTAESDTYSGDAVGQYSSLGEAVAAHVNGRRIGIEEEFASAGLAAQLADHAFELITASNDLAHWRDIRDHEDLPFQLIAARTSVYAIEEALAWADKQLDAGAQFTELDIYAQYLGFVEQFAHEHAGPFDVKPYFTNLHSSNRMLFPGPPVDYPIDAQTRCIQLDAGVSVSVDGVVVATSDMARSLPRTPSAKEAYEFFFTVVREGIIGQLRPGVVCEDVHEGTLDFLAPHLARMIEIGMLGKDTDFNTIYRRRNVGHLMGKQESFANELRPGYKHALDVGSYGAAEIPWRYNGVAIGTEDMWFIGSDRTYILTQR